MSVTKAFAYYYPDSLVGKPPPMTELHDGVTEVDADWRRLEAGIEALQDFAEWLGTHIHVPHPELETVWLWDASIALDLIDETWSIEPAADLDRCKLVRQFGPFRFVICAPGWPFGTIQERPEGNKFVPFQMKHVLRNRVALTAKAERQQ